LQKAKTTLTAKARPKRAGILRWQRFECKSESKFFYIFITVYKQLETYFALWNSPWAGVEYENPYHLKNRPVDLIREGAGIKISSYLPQGEGQGEGGSSYCMYSRLRYTQLRQQSLKDFKWKFHTKSLSTELPALAILGGGLSLDQVRWHSASCNPPHCPSSIYTWPQSQSSKILYRHCHFDGKQLEYNRL